MNPAKVHYSGLWVGLFTAAIAAIAPPTLAQTPTPPVLPQPNLRPDFSPPPPPPVAPEPLPDPAELLPTLEPDVEDTDLPASDLVLPGDDLQITVEQFEFVGNAAFTDAELQAVLAETYLNRPLTFEALLQARAAITEFYAEAGYTTSGAFIPPQPFADGTVTIQVIEGELIEIAVVGTDRLNENYVRDRLTPYTTAPLNLDSLLEGLQLLQLDPLIETVSSELAAGLQPGQSVLTVEVVEADSFAVDFGLDNYRVPSVGTVRQRVELREANVLGDGESLTVSYANTRGSDTLDWSAQIFTHPANNSTLGIRAGLSGSEVIAAPFDELELKTESYYFELSYRHPIQRRPTEEFALGVTFSHQQSRSDYLRSLFGEPIPFVTVGSDDQGRSRITALRFFQDWVRREDRQVFAARSEFSLGLDLLDPLIQDNLPDSRFLAWRGQAQFVRLLDTDSLLILRADAQLADQALMSLEQFGLGGGNTVRGYRQDLLLTDNGVLVSAEARFPVLRVPEWEGLLQVAPFVDLGAGWNPAGAEPDPNGLAAIGVGLLWQQSDWLSARLDWGIPLVDVDLPQNTLQEEGITFSLVVTPF